jgi:hypothetical protein
MNLKKDTKVMLKVDLFAGSEIADIAKILCRLATALDVIATAQFNEVTLYAKPNADPDEMVKGYEGAKDSSRTYKMAWANTKPQPSVEMHFEGEPMMVKWSLKIADLHATVIRIRDLINLPSALDNNSKIILIEKHAALALEKWESR